VKEETVGRLVVTSAKIVSKTTGFMAKAVGKVVFVATKMAGSGMVAAGKEGLKSLKGGKRG